MHGVALSGKNTGRAMQQLIDAIGGDEAGLNGLKNAFAEYIDTHTQTTIKNIANQPTTSPAGLSRLMKKFDPAMEVLYKNEPEKMEALKTIQRAYEVAGRTAYSPVSAGSDTVEKTLSLLSKTKAVGNTAADLGMFVLTPRTLVVKNAAKKYFDYLSKQSTETVEQMVTRALYDPDYAQLLIKGAQGKLDPKTLEVTVGGKIVRLDDYRKTKLTQAMTGSLAAESNQGN